jgi:hypothetical protein
MPRVLLSKGEKQAFQKEADWAAIFQCQACQFECGYTFSELQVIRGQWIDVAFGPCPGYTKLCGAWNRLRLNYIYYNPEVMERDAEQCEPISHIIRVHQPFKDEPCGALGVYLDHYFDEPVQDGDKH